MDGDECRFEDDMSQPTPTTCIGALTPHCYTVVFVQREPVCASCASPLRTFGEDFLSNDIFLYVLYHDIPVRAWVYKY
jgi:hypothetical protein